MVSKTASAAGPILRCQRASPGVPVETQNRRRVGPVLSRLRLLGPGLAFGRFTVRSVISSLRSANSRWAPFPLIMLRTVQDRTGDLHRFVDDRDGDGLDTVVLEIKGVAVGGALLQFV